MRQLILAFCLLFANYFITNAQSNLNLGLVAYYPFNDNANDASGNGHHGTVVNSPLLSSDYYGRNNAAYTFNGSNNYIKLGDILDTIFAKSPIAYFSVSGWAKTLADASFQGDNVITAKSSGGSSGPYQWYINHENDGKVKGLISYSTSAATNFYEVQSLNTVPLNTWFNFILTYDGSITDNTQRLKFYVNGVKGNYSRKAGLGGTTTNNTSQEITIGGMYDSSNGDPLNIYNGEIDEIRFYNRTLDSLDIIALQNYTTVYRTGIDETQLNRKLSLYPNPTNDGILHFSNNQINQVKIYNSIGQLIKVIKVQNAELNVQDLSEGIYYLEASSLEFDGIQTVFFRKNE